MFDKLKTTSLVLPWFGGERQPLVKYVLGNEKPLATGQNPVLIQTDIKVEDFARVLEEGGRFSPTLADLICPRS